MNITCKRQYEQLKVYINGQLHLQLKLLDLIGFQSWVHGPNEYFIEYYYTNMKITTAYGCRERWSEVLKLLDVHLSTTG